MMMNDELQMRYELAMRNRYAERTCLAYEQDLWRFFNYFNRKREVVLTLATSQIESFLKYQATLKDKEGQRQFSDRSINRLRAAITGLYDYAIEMGWTTYNPASAIKTTKVKEETVEYLTEREITSLLCLIGQTKNKDKFVSMRDHLMVRLTLYTGLTTFEILNLKFDQIDFENGILTIQDVNQVSRTVPLPMVLKEEYEAYLVKRLEIPCLEEAEKLIFITQNGTPIKAQSFSNTLMKYSKKLRMLKGVSQSVLRHTYAHQKIQEGMGAIELSVLLGHNNQYYTQRLYETWLKEANDPTIPKVMY